MIYETVQNTERFFVYINKLKAFLFLRNNRSPGRKKKTETCSDIMHCKLPNKELIITYDNPIANVFLAPTVFAICISTAAEMKMISTPNNLIATKESGKIY